MSSRFGGYRAGATDSLSACLLVFERVGHIADPLLAEALIRQLTMLIDGNQHLGGIAIPTCSHLQPEQSTVTAAFMIRLALRPVPLNPQCLLQYRWSPFTV
jgi:hypothetical protein